MKLQSNNIWFTSDTHYSHSNLVRGTTNWRNEHGEVPVEQVRNFETLEQMNDLMVENINAHVKAKDWLIHLGDWSFGGYDRVKEFRDQINCQNIVLILGNHDHHIQRDKPNGPLRKLFTHVAHYEELAISRGSDQDKNKIVLCHYPIISWNNMHHGSYMLHGHQHLKGDKRFGHGRRMDVGLCGSEDFGFRPYHIQEILDTLKNRTLILPETEHHITNNGIQ
jgi:calcineurin-like phosphoesterase family protein